MASFVGLSSCWGNWPPYRVLCLILRRLGLVLATDVDELSVPESGALAEANKWVDWAELDLARDVAGLDFLALSWPDEAS